MHREGEGQRPEVREEGGRAGRAEEEVGGETGPAWKRKSEAYRQMYRDRKREWRPPFTLASCFFFLGSFHTEWLVGILLPAWLWDVSS